MCLIVFSWQPDAKQMLTLASNRDEFYARPSQSADYWSDKPTIFGGRDLKMHGTWLAVSRTMRFAAVTNYRSPDTHSYPRSRGEIPSDFLTSNDSAFDFAQEIQKNTYAGFNALLFDGTHLVYCHNQKNNFGMYEKAIVLTAGEYGLSNHLLNTSWPKVERTKASLSEIQHLNNKSDITQGLLKALKNDEKASDADLPNTGVKLEFERLVSSPFITSPNYGTRTSTIVIIDRLDSDDKNKPLKKPLHKAQEIYFHERQYHKSKDKFEDNTYTITQP
jgi:uncharacterized protein with NRDE domain